MLYVVERYLPDISREELESILRRVRETACELQNEGTPVRYLGSTIVLDDEACFCQFEAPSDGAVAALNHRARAPFDRIVAAVAIAPTPGHV